MSDSGGCRWITPEEVALMNAGIGVMCDPVTDAD